MFGRARDEKLSEFLLRRKWNLRKAEACNFFFFFNKEGKDSGPQIKQLTGNSSDVIALFYYLLIGRHSS